ncbi:ADP-ribosylation factor-like protein [Geobacter sp.]|uniref:GTP-binding protein n=1 Tax=Geobacter sp. TaxID=46610 RepID=UPI00260653A5|nr:ADP-ribosylation factor-like protein [Geobacter sp.]
MALFNKSKREINAKIVYFGPPYAGKSTSLKFVHRKLKPEHRSPLKTMGGQRDRMLFFDFMPPELGDFNGCRVRFHVYTVQGEVASPSSWKTVLKGADGIVFVADSSAQGVAASRDYLEKLREYMAGFEQTFAMTPCVVQCTKGDLPDAAGPAEMLQALSMTGVTALPVVATTGEGVIQALSAVVKQILSRLREQRFDEEAAEGELTTGSLSEEPVSEEPAAPAAAAASPAMTESSESPEPSLEISGPSERSADGLFRIPLIVKYGTHRKHYQLSLQLSELQE